MSEWQDIETAPKDGTWILGWPLWSTEDREGKYHKRSGEIKYVEGAGYWFTMQQTMPAWSPTHWMPLPEPPK